MPAGFHCSFLVAATVLTSPKGGARADGKRVFVFALLPRVSLMLKKAALGLLGIYQNYIRIILPCSCRFVPTCSDYTREAIIRYGVLPGALKGIRRVLGCHSLSCKSGYDPLL